MTQSQIPKFSLHSSASNATVTQWGVAMGLIFRPGDRVLLGPVSDGGLLLLRPHGYGGPMLGQRIGEQLFAEPGGVPASPIRWRPAGGVIAVERPLDAAAPDLLGVLGIGRWVMSEQSRRLLGTLPMAHQHGQWTVWHSRPSCASDDPSSDWVSVSRLVRMGLGRDVVQHGLVIGRTTASASVLPPRPGWVRYVLAPAAAVIASDWCGEALHAGARSAS